MKKVVFILFVGVLGVFVGQRVQETSTTVNDVLLANVEALADTEVEGPMTCRGDGDFICPGNSRKVFEVYIGYSLR